MAKKKTAKKTTGENTTTYSTRLNDQQRVLIEEAAAISGVSASKFIRDAALQAAADTVNANGSNDAAILAAMMSLADVLKKPQATVTYFSEVVQHSTERTISIADSSTSLDIHIEDNKGHDLHFQPVSIQANTLRPYQLKTLTEIAASCPITFSDAFRRAVEGTTESKLKFTPKANPRAMLED